MQLIFGHPLFHRRTLLWGIALALLLFIWPGGFRLYFGSDDEISYSAGFDFTTCSGFLANESIDSERCRADYRITLGNTGSKPQEHIQIDLAPVPPTWRLAVNVTDIVASAREKIQPEIEHSQVDDTLTITIDNLQPNRMVSLQLMTIGEEAAELLAIAEAEVHSSGELLETGPHLTVVTRFFRSLFALFGL